VSLLVNYLNQDLKLFTLYKKNMTLEQLFNIIISINCECEQIGIGANSKYSQSKKAHSHWPLRLPIKICYHQKISLKKFQRNKTHFPRISSQNL
jgi:hypothetical protein